MHKRLKRLLIVIASISIVIVIFLIQGNRTVNISYTEEEAINAYNLLFDNLENQRYTYIDFLNENEIDYSLSNYNATISSEISSENLEYEYDGDFVAINPGEFAEYSVNVNKSGLYYLETDYLVDDSVLSNPTISISINGDFQFDESKVIDVPLYWQDDIEYVDDNKLFILDTYGDESLPSQKRIGGWHELLMYNNLYYTVDPLMFNLRGGINTIKIENISSDVIYFGQLEVLAPNETVTYDEYVDDLGIDISNKPEQIIITNAINYNIKNSSFVRMSSFDSPSVTPHDRVYKLNNIIDGESWADAGQEITYEIEVTNSGYYNLAMHYSNYKNDFSVFRSIYIDGEIPFEEFKNYEFEPTKGSLWEIEIAGGLESYQIYLTEGTHTITFRAEHESIIQSIRNLQLVLDHINQFALEIKKVTGAAEIDTQRTWKLTQYIPETAQYLEAYEILLKQMIDQMSVYAPNGYNSATLASLVKGIFKLDMMQEDPDELPLYLDDLFSDTSSLTQLLGTTMEDFYDQELYLDEFYLFNNEDLLPKENANIFQKFASGIASFFATFTSEKYNIEKDPEAVTIWVNRPITNIDIMQKLADASFTPETGIKVKFSVMPDATKLVLAAAADNTPDVALGLLSYMPFELAIRGALYDLSSFDDFWYVAGDFVPGAMIPYVLDDKVYAIPETLDFHTLIYREDIFRSLDLTPPDTWDDVVNILPVLQRYGMNFYFPTAGGTSLKWFYQTTPLIYQFGGSIYSEDGLNTTINSPESVEGIRLLGDLFNKYSMPEQVPIFYNSFRYGTLPVGITDFTTYLQLKNAAPELVGQWSLAPYPGVYDEETDTVQRWFVANGVSGVILKDTEKAEESWEFLKWWMSESVQTTYAYQLQSTFGPEFVWLSANLNAFDNSPIDYADKQVILEQVKWLHDVPRTPGQYMLERGLSDIWNTIVFDGTPTTVAIDRQVLIINREIERKMIEFGYIDEEGNVLKEYIIRDVEWIQEQMDNARGDE